MELHDKDAAFGHPEYGLLHVGVLVDVALRFVHHLDGEQSLCVLLPGQEHLGHHQRDGDNTNPLKSGGEVRLVLGWDEKGEQESEVVWWLIASRPSNMRVYLRDGSAQTILRAATLRWKLQTKVSISPSQSILTPGRQVLALTLQRQAPGRVATGVPILKSLV